MAPDRSNPFPEFAFMFDTKFVIVVREDLAQWQKLNVTAFLATGVAGAVEGLLGEELLCCFRDD